MNLNTGPYHLGSWINTVYALDIAIENHLGYLLLDGDLSRIIYSDVAYALRKRYTSSSVQGLDLPFISYKISSLVGEGSDRQWWNHTANIEGIWVEELQRKLRYTPITVEYEVGVFTHKNIDNLYMQNQFMWDYSNETVLEPILEIDDLEFSIPAVLNHSINYDPAYSQSDWLQQNKIHSIEATLTFETFIIQDNYDVSIPETVIFNFLQNKGVTIEEGNNYQALKDLLTDEQGEFELV